MNKKHSIIKRIISILIVSSILAFIYNTFSEDGIPVIRQPIIVETVNFITDDGNTKSLRGVNLNTVIDAFNNNKAIFIDARDQWEYSDGHILGAINIPEFSFTPNDKKLEEINKDAIIIVYCDGDECDTSKRLTNELSKLGFNNCYVFLDGFSAWKESELPTQEGESND